MIAVGKSKSRRLERAVSEHRAALSSFVEFVRRLDGAEWTRSSGEGKWTPAEVTEHLALAYEAAVRELETGAPMAPKLSRGRQSVLRWLLLPHMLFHRTMPRVRSPREARPARSAASVAEGLARLQQTALRFERAYQEREDAQLTHPYFGPLSRVQAFRLSALHLEHHQRLLSAVLTTTG